MSLFIVLAITSAISAISSLIIGFVWFGPIFGKTYAAITGMDMNDPVKVAQGKKAMPYMAGINLVISFIMYYAFGFASVILVNPSMPKAIVIFSLFIWLGFIVPVLASNALWSGKSPKMSLKLFALTAGCQLISIVLAGVIWMGVYPSLI